MSAFGQTLRAARLAALLLCIAHLSGCVPMLDEEAGSPAFVCRPTSTDGMRWAKGGQICRSVESGQCYLLIKFRSGYGSGGIVEAPCPEEKR